MGKKTQNALLLLVFGGVLTWAGTQILKIEPQQTKVEMLEQKADENRDSIQALIDIHLKQ